MSGPVSDNNTDSEFTRYAPKRYREQLATPEAEQPPYVASASTAPWSTEVRRDRRTRSDLWPEPIPEPPTQWGDGLLALIGRVVLVAALAAGVALLVVFGKPVLEGIRPLLDSDFAGQASLEIKRSTYRQ